MLDPTIQRIIVGDLLAQSCSNAELDIEQLKLQWADRSNNLPPYEIGLSQIMDFLSFVGYCSPGWANNNLMLPQARIAFV
jgi:hypothetical protein